MIFVKGMVRVHGSISSDLGVGKRGTSMRGLFRVCLGNV